MTKYVDNSKADKARRKKLVVVGVLPKAKAKAFLKRNAYFQNYEIYGIYLDGMVEIGVSNKRREQFIEIDKKKVREAAV